MEIVQTLTTREEAERKAAYWNLYDAPHYHYSVSKSEGSKWSVVRDAMNDHGNGGFVSLSTTSRFA